MTDPADFLRRHPDVREYLVGALDQWEAYRREGGDITPDQLFGTVLPAILAAHEADLAGDAREVATEIGHSTAVQTCCNNPVRGKNGEPECCGAPDVQFIFTADTEDRIATALSAAYLAGRNAGREEAAKVADAEKVERFRRAESGDPNYGDPMVQNHKAVTAMALAAAIRSLP